MCRSYGALRTFHQPFTGFVASRVRLRRSDLQFLSRTCGACGGPSTIWRGQGLVSGQRDEVSWSGLRISEKIVSGGEVSQLGFKMDCIAVTFDKSCRQRASRTF